MSPSLDELQVVYEHATYPQNLKAAKAYIDALRQALEEATARCDELIRLHNEDFIGSARWYSEMVGERDAARVEVNRLEAVNERLRHRQWSPHAVEELRAENEIAHHNVGALQAEVFQLRSLLTEIAACDTRSVGVGYTTLEMTSDLWDRIQQTTP